jgi:hypothetical protein
MQIYDSLDPDSDFRPFLVVNKNHITPAIALKPQSTSRVLASTVEPPPQIICSRLRTYAFHFYLQHAL